MKRNPQLQQGFTLFMALVMLLLLTLIGTTAARLTIKEEKMSSNLYDSNLAFQATETGLVSGENWILALTAAPTPSGSCTHPCVLTFSPNLYPEEQSESWWDTNSAVYSGSLNQVIAQPRYFIEFLRFIPDTQVIGVGVPTGLYYYRVTAKGNGGSNSAVRVLQSTVARRY